MPAAWRGPSLLTGLRASCHSARTGPEARDLRIRAACEHLESRWSKCPHEYKIRYRNAAGRQTEESGFATQDKAKTRLAEVYHARKNSPQSQRKAERIQKYGVMHFSDYVAEWLKGQRDLSPTSLRNLDSLLRNHLLPAFGNRRMGTFDHKVVEAFWVMTAVHPQARAGEFQGSQAAWPSRASVTGACPATLG
ncbi:hypothetical protein [Kitasatospora sp. NPDC087314]|uniref:hypothetical protein n=1 Tax=Kitasatospora sp. NPDC087314 TaxID=3364068 RepID=UPI00382DB8FA